MADPVPFTDEVTGAPPSADPDAMRDWFHGVMPSGPAGAISDAYDDLHPADQVVAHAHLGMHGDDQDSALQAGMFGVPASTLTAAVTPSGAPTAADEAAPGYIDFSKPDSSAPDESAPGYLDFGDALPPEDHPLAPPPETTEASAVTDEYKPTTQADSILNENKREPRPSSLYSDNDLMRMATSNNPYDRAKFDTIRRGDQLYDEQRMAEERLRNSAAQRQLAAEQIEIQAKAAAATQAKMDAANAAADRVAKYGRQDYLTGRSTAKKLGDFISLIAGGVAAGQVPGGNGVNHAAVDFENEINESIKDQLSNLGQKRSALSDEFKRTGDLNQSIYAVKQAALQSTYNDITTEAQKYDPRGSRGVALAAQAQQTLGTIAAGQEQLRAAHAKEDIEGAKAGLDVQKAAAEQAHQKEQEKVDRERINVEKQRAWESERAAKAQEALGTRKQDFTEWKDVQKAAASTAAQKGQIGGIVTGIDEYGRPKYTDENGQPAVIRQADGSALTLEPKAFERIAPMIAHGDDVNRLANKLSREISEWGGQSDIVKGGHWQTIKGDYQDLVFALHGAKDIKGFRPGTAEALHELTGDVDPTSFIRDATPGIQTAKNNINADIDTELRRTGKWTDPNPYSPIDTSVLPPVTKSDIDTEAENAASLNSGERHAAGISATGGAGATAVALSQKAGEASRQKSLDFIEKQLDKDDVPTRQNALSAIYELIKKAPTDAVAKRAQEIWDKKSYAWVGQLAEPKASPSKPGAPAKTPQSDLLTGLRKDLLSTDAAKRNLAVKMLMRLGAVHPTEAEPSQTESSGAGAESEGGDGAD